MTINFQKNIWSNIIMREFAKQENFKDIYIYIVTYVRSTVIEEVGVTLLTSGMFLEAYN